MVITRFNLYTNRCFCKYGHDSEPKGSPDMILNAFHVKFDEKKKEISPRACRPPTKIPNSKNYKKCIGEWVPRPLERGSGERQLADKIPVFFSRIILLIRAPIKAWWSVLYTPIYFHIPPYTLIYLQIPAYTLFIPIYIYIYS